MAEWVQDDQTLAGQDIVAWFSAGSHHIPRMEDWPVMPTEWKTVHIMLHNFFANDPAQTQLIIKQGRRQASAACQRHNLNG